MAYYSISVHARNIVLVAEAKVVLEPGLNVFTVVLDDVAPLLTYLRNEDVRILSCQQLDTFDALPEEFRTTALSS